MAAVTKEVIYKDNEKHPHWIGPTAPGSANSGPETSDVNMAKDPTVNQTWRSYVWDTLDKSPRERRLFVGPTQSCFNPATLYILGSWYRKDELAKRSCIFQASSFVGAMFSGYLMTATYRLDSVQGFEGWQWLFIINFVISS